MRCPYCNGTGKKPAAKRDRNSVGNRLRRLVDYNGDGSWTRRWFLFNKTNGRLLGVYNTREEARAAARSKP